jgi:signal transduction histidine kinase
VTILFVGYDVLKHKEYIEENGFYKSFEFIGGVNRLTNDLISYVKFYKGEAYVNNILDQDIKNKQQELENQLKQQINNINGEYDYQISSAKSQNNTDEENRLLKEKNDKINQLNEKYKKQIGDTDKIRQDISADRKDDLQKISSRIDSFKNIKYIIIDNKDGYIKSNVSYDKNAMEYAVKNDSSFYIKTYQIGTIDYQYVYDCSLKFSKSDNIKSYLDNIAIDMKSSDVTLYLSSGKGLQEGDIIYFQYQRYLEGKEIIKKELVVSAIASIILIISILLLIKNKVKNRGEELTSLDNIPIEIKLAFMAFSIWLALYVKQFYDIYSRNYLYVILAICLTSASIVIFIKEAIRLSHKDIRKEILKRSVFNRIYPRCRQIARITKEMLYIKSVFFKVLFFMISILFIILPTTVLTILLLEHDANLWGGILSIFIVLFSLFTIAYSFRKLAMINKIIIGAERICSGDLNYSIEAKGKGNLARLANNINNMKAGLKNSIENEVKSDRLKTELITNVSHDLKTPLTSIINYVDLLKKDDISTEEMRDYIKVLDRKSQRLKVLIEDLFEASKAASGALELNIERVEVSSLLKQTLAEFEEKIKEAELDFRVSYPEEKLYTMADGKKLWRVFENLITNILKYSLNRTRVYILMFNEEGKIKISMKNISAYELEIDSEELVERFKRGDKSRNTEGSGLGLAIAKSLVELQKGVFNIEIDGDLFKVIMEFTEVK